MTFLGHRPTHDRNVGLKEWIVRYRNMIKKECESEVPNQFKIAEWEKKIDEYHEELKREHDENFCGRY